MTPRPATSLLLGLALLAQGMAPGSAQAQVGSTALAEGLFREGQRLLAEGQVHAACEKLSESYKLDKANGTLLNLASCHERDGRLATAWSEYSALVSAAGQAGQTERAALARSKVAELDPKVPKLHLVMPDGSGIDHLALDGQDLGRAAWDLDIPLDAGPHVVEVAGAGRTSARLSTEVAKSGRTELRLPVLATSDSQTPAGGESAGSGRRTAGFVVGAVGLVGLAAGSVFGVRALGLKSDADGACDATTCSPEGKAFEDDAHTSATISTVAFAVGLVGVGLGTYLLVSAASGKSSRSALSFVTQGVRW